MRNSFFGLTAAIGILLGVIFVAFLLAASLPGCYGDIPHGNGGNIYAGVDEIYYLGDCPLDPNEGEPTPTPTPGDGGAPDPTPTPTSNPTPTPSPTPDNPYACAPGKTEVCHRPLGQRPNKFISICIGDAAVDAHIKHGDYLGFCDEE